MKNESLQKCVIDKPFTKGQMNITPFLSLSYLVCETYFAKTCKPNLRSPFQTFRDIYYLGERFLANY